MVGGLAVLEGIAGAILCATMVGGPLGLVLLGESLGDIFAAGSIMKTRDFSWV